jgi:hypothetical protein
MARNWGTTELIPDPTALQNPATKNYVDTTKLQLIGGYMTDQSTATILSAGAATSETDLGTRMRSNSISFLSGHLYLALLNINGQQSTEPGDAWDFRLRIGSATGTLFGGVVQLAAGSTWSNQPTFAIPWLCGANVSGAMFTTYVRAAGSGNLSIGAMGSTTGSSSLLVFECGSAQSSVINHT